MAVFPFSAIVGQEEIKRALLIAAVQPRIGGVMIFGDRGTGEPTAARASRLRRALAHGEKRFEPGLLAKAHRGFLYIDEINLLDRFGLSVDVRTPQPTAHAAVQASLLCCLCLLAALKRLFLAISFRDLTLWGWAMDTADRPRHIWTRKRD